MTINFVPPDQRSPQQDRPYININNMASIKKKNLDSPRIYIYIHRVYTQLSIYPRYVIILRYFKNQSWTLR